MIREVIDSRPITSQTALVKELKKRGLAVTQATISRDIAEMELVKRRNLDGRTVYCLQEQTVLQPAEKLVRAMAEFALSLARSNNLLVIKTTPGAAQTVAGSIDQTDAAEIMGTVAGDDTILVITRSKEQGRRIEQVLQEMMR